ncbi:MAG TPA: GTP-binding protein, partial [Glaciibacter sp.]|nr:GTP-binding protein [Glaciibacter sp.]
MPGKGTNDPSRGNGRGGAVTAADHPEKIRNVALVGRSGAGKTMLSEALLQATGVINRMGSIVDGTTVSDSDPAEVHQQRSVTLSVLPLPVGDVKVNLLDTPGYGDFIGDVRAGLRAADAALFAVSAVDGVDAATTALWEECERIGMPRAVVISRIDHPRANYEGVLAACQDAFGAAVLPLYLPIRTGTAITGVLGLLSQTVSDYSGGGPRPDNRPANDGERAEAEAPRGELIEGIIAESEDETLMDRYLGGEDIAFDTLVADLEIAVARGSFYPVLATSAEAGVGMAELLEVLVGAFPSPVEREVPAVTDLNGNPAGPLSPDP